METSKKKIIATIECRMTSTRLPGKVLMPAVAGMSFLELIVSRIKKVEELDAIVIATTTNSTDDEIEKLAKKMNVSCFRGSEDDVLQRVLGAAHYVNADIIVELHGDCPFVDPQLISQMINFYLKNPCDYAKNFEPDTYPDGLDVQVFSTALLETADKLGKSDDDREHVSWYFRNRPEEYKHLTLNAPKSLMYTDLKLTLDTKEDLHFIESILPDIYALNENFTIYDVINYMRNKNEI